MRVYRAGKIYPVILEYIRTNPGKTAKQIHAGLSKTDPDVAAVKFGAFSGGISNMVNTGRLTYRPHTPVDGDKSMYTVFYKSSKISHKRVFNKGHKKRVFRKSKIDRMITGEVIVRDTKPNSAAKVDVQLLIAIGDRDTMVGFETARSLYEQLKGIFEHN